MKTWRIALFVMGYASEVLALDKAELDHRIRRLTAKLEAMQARPDKCILSATLNWAEGVVLLDRTKAGFTFACQGGGGLALVKDSTDQKCSPAAFVTATERSLGAEIGGQQSFFEVLFMNTNATRLLTEPNFEFGGEARGTGGDSSAGVEGAIASSEPGGPRRAEDGGGRPD